MELKTNVVYEQNNGLKVKLSKQKYSKTFIATVAEDKTVGSYFYRKGTVNGTRNATGMYLSVPTSPHSINLSKIYARMDYGLEYEE